MDTNDKLRKRVAELESDVASIGGALQYAERKIRQMEVDENRDDCRMALNKARRVVEHERKLAAAQDVWDRIGEIRTECARYGPALQEASECLRIQAKHVAELETVVTTLEDRCDEYAAALNDSAELCDRLRAYYRRERRAVEVLANALVMSGSCMLGYDHTSLSDCSLSTNCRACWVAWAQKRASE